MASKQMAQKQASVAVAEQALIQEIDGLIAEACASLFDGGGDGQSH